MATCGYCTAPSHVALACPVKTAAASETATATAASAPSPEVTIVDDPVSFPVKETVEKPKKVRQVFAFRRLDGTDTGV